MLSTLLIVLLVLVLFVVAFMLVRTILYGRTLEMVEPVELADVSGEVVAEHLAVALRHQTISEEDPSKTNPQPFTELRKSLEKMYPRVHATMRLERVNHNAMLYTWKGKNESLEPMLLASHCDVVPVDPASRDEWRFPAFEGRIAEGCVWGRGALDNKNTLIAILEAAEALIKAGYQPERTVLLAIGDDEEVGGQQGAAQIAAHLEKNAVHLSAVLDEGGAIFTGSIIPGLNLPVALVGTSEKGYLTLMMETEGSGGHAAFPPPHTAIGVLARAIERLEAAPLPPRPQMAEMMFRHLGGVLPFGLRMAFANMWLLGPVVESQMVKRPRTAAMLRTTTAVTMIQGGLKDNVLPGKATTAVNFRLIPGDRVADVVQHVRRVIHDDAVQLHIPEHAAWEASPVSPVDAPAFQSIAKTVQQVYPEAVVAPYLVQGGTDGRYYYSVCEHVYRLSPMALSDELLGTMHNKNERIEIGVLARMVQFYIQLIKAWGVA
jgi:carboxypeptidase PM20D1